MTKTAFRELSSDNKTALELALKHFLKQHELANHFRVETKSALIGRAITRVALYFRPSTTNPPNIAQHCQFLDAVEELKGFVTMDSPQVYAPGERIKWLVTDVDTVQLQQFSVKQKEQARGAAADDLADLIQGLLAFAALERQVRQRARRNAEEGGFFGGVARANQQDRPNPSAGDAAANPRVVELDSQGYEIGALPKLDTLPKASNRR